MNKIIKNTLLYINLEATRNKRSRILVFLDMAFNYLLYKVLPQEYYHFGFYKKTREDKKTYFTYKLYCQRRREFSNYKYEDVIFQDKYIFSKVFHEYYGRKSMLFSQYTTFEEFRLFMVGCNKIVYKPCFGCEGGGIRTYSVSDYDSLEQLFNAIPKSEALLDEWLEQDECMSRFYPKGLNCIRVYTFLHNGHFEFIDAKVSFGINSDIVNATLNHSLFGLVDVMTGKITSNLANYNLDVYEEHPVTHFKAKGTQLPRWNEVLDLARRAAYIVPQVAYVGWDIAITKKGTVLIEGNHCGGCGGNQFCVLREQTTGTRDVWDVKKRL